MAQPWPERPAAKQQERETQTTVAATTCRSAPPRAMSVVAPERRTSMDARVPVTDLDPAYSSPGAEPTPWASARDRLAEAEVAWLSTVRPDGRPHATPLLTVWFDGALHFCTGAEERKARNLADEARCV